MGSIKDKVAIVGMGCTKFGENWDMSQDDMMIEATYEALEDAGIELKDIEAAWLGIFCPSSPTGQLLGKSSRTPLHTCHQSRECMCLGYRGH